MKLFLLPAFGMMVAMSVAEPKPAESGLEAQLQKLQELLGQRAAILNDLVVEKVPSEEGGVLAPQAPKSVGLQMGTLGSGSIQPAGGLQSKARGLTPEAEWRRNFPHKPGYSR